MSDDELAWTRECPAWADGEHCFEVMWESRMAYGAIVSRNRESADARQIKKCACGATVDPKAPKDSEDLRQPQEET